MNAPVPHPLGLHQLTLMDVAPVDLIDIAAAIDCQHVTLFVRGAGRRGMTYPLVADPADRAAVLARARAAGVRVHNVEVFIIGPGTRAEAFEPALAMGADLGAARLTCLIADPDEPRAFDVFADFCARAARHGLAVHVEFHAFCHLKTLVATRDFLRGRCPPNASIALDPLHLYRNDGTLDGLDAVSDTPIGYAQICDGPLVPDIADALDEAINERRLPGLGAFDLRRFVRALPAGMVIDMEVPSRSLRATGLSPLERARRVVAATRAVLDAAA